MKTIAAGVLSITLLAGCATVPPFPEPDRTWKSYSGQLQYTGPKSSLIGEFVASGKGEDFRFEFTKGGAVPLIRVSRHGQYGKAEGPLARGRWQGEASRAPAVLGGWVVEVPRAFAGVQSAMRVAGGVAHTGAAAAPAPKRVEITGTQPGERFVFVFSR